MEDEIKPTREPQFVSIRKQCYACVSALFSEYNPLGLSINVYQAITALRLGPVARQNTDCDCKDCFGSVLVLNFKSGMNGLHTHVAKQKPTKGRGKKLQPLHNVFCVTKKETVRRSENRYFDTKRGISRLEEERYILGAERRTSSIKYPKFKQVRQQHFLGPFDRVPCCVTISYFIFFLCSISILWLHQKNV